LVVDNSYAAPVIRRQLSLYVAEPEASRLEALRATLDPLQHALIPAHATLGRDGDFGTRPDLEWRELIAGLREPALRLRFGGAESFHEHGILVRCIDGAERFDALRERVFGHAALPLAPHLTLAHPRNPRAPGNSLAAARAALPMPLELRFDSLNLIEQFNGGRWRVLARALLK
jgi:2'-5' RNA ligase